MIRGRNHTQQRRTVGWFVHSTDHLLRRAHIALSFFHCFPLRRSLFNGQIKKVPRPSGEPPRLRMVVEEAVFDGLLPTTFPCSSRLPALHSVAAAAFLELSLSPSDIPSLLASASWPSLFTGAS